MIVENCAQCDYGAQHSLHITIGAGNAITFTDDGGNLVQPPSTFGHFCPLCHEEVSFIDPEFGNAFCLPCQWMGEVVITLPQKNEDALHRPMWRHR